jgi:hypothetical protein
MHTAFVLAVMFQARVDALLLHEDRISQSPRRLAKRRPVRHLHADHRLAALIAEKQIAQGGRHGFGFLGRGIGKDIDQFTMHKALFPPEDGRLQSHRRVADMRTADTHVELLVVAR